jgi:hypothetical protein
MLFAGVQQNGVWMVKGRNAFGVQFNKVFVQQAVLLLDDLFGF